MDSPRSSCLALILAVLIPASALAVPVFEKDDFKLDLGLRIQPRLELTQPGIAANTFDFLVRRTRFKAKGQVFICSFNLEWKLENIDRTGTTPAVQLENAYANCPVLGDTLEVRAGMFDAPYSRDILVSDSQQMTADRGPVSNDVSALGLADNVTGVMLHGKVAGGMYTYAAGAFDNRQLTNFPHEAPLFVARGGVSLGSKKAKTPSDAYFGEGTVIDLALNGVYQPGVRAANQVGSGFRSSWGADMAVDFPMGPGRLTARGEANYLASKDPLTGNITEGLVWMGGVGYLYKRIQPVFRLDQRVPRMGDSQLFINPGVNVYIKEHNLKVQLDLVEEVTGGIHGVDLIRLQGQVDF